LLRITDFGQRKYSSAFAREQLPYAHKGEHVHGRVSNLHAEGLEQSEYKFGRYYKQIVQDNLYGNSTYPGSRQLPAEEDIF